jgi:hypothetical protein
MPYIATRTFQTKFGQVDYGRHIPDGDPILSEAGEDDVRKASADEVTKEAARAAEDIEQATAIPGEKRQTRRS